MPWLSPGQLSGLQAVLDASLPNVFITRYALTSRNQSDDPTHSPVGTTYRAWIKYAVGIVRAPSGEEITYQTEVRLGSDAPRFSRGDRIVLPDGSEPPILLVVWYPPGEAAYYQHLYLGTSGQAVR